MFVMLTQDLTKGFASWKNMFLENKQAFKNLGGQLVFAGPERDNDNKMMVIIKFDSAEAMKAFATDEELCTKRAASGAVLESNVITHLSDESFTGT